MSKTSGDATPTTSSSRHAEVRLPADSAYASVLRTTSAALAARLDFTIDDIEDLRMAVGEATALVLPAAAPDTELLAEFELAPAEVTVRLSATTAEHGELDTDSFAWMVLSTLATRTDSAATDGRLQVEFTVASTIAQALEDDIVAGPGN